MEVYVFSIKYKSQKNDTFQQELWILINYGKIFACGGHSSGRLFKRRGSLRLSDTWGLDCTENTRNFSKRLTVLIDSSLTLTENHPQNFGGQGSKSDGQGHSTTRSGSRRRYSRLNERSRSIRDSRHLQFNHLSSINGGYQEFQIKFYASFVIESHGGISMMIKITIDTVMKIVWTCTYQEEISLILPHKLR